MKEKKWLLVVILGTLSAIGPLSIDLYLPGFPSIAKDFNTTIENVAYSLSSFFIGISLGQLVYGPFLDRYGRKPPLLTGLVLYILGSTGCMLAGNLQLLILFRAVQAFGGCVAMVAPRAIVRDLFPVQENARILTFLMLIIGVSPIIAPSIGSYLIEQTNWRYSFGVMILLSVLILFGTVLFLKESKKPDPKISLKPQAVLISYWQLLKNPRFLVYALAGTFSAAGFFAYLSGSPFALIQLYGFSQKQYGLIFGLISMGLIVASQINGALLKKWPTQAILKWAVIVQAATGIFLYVISLLQLLSAGVFIGLVLLFVSCCGFIFSDASALAMEPFQKEAGFASALLGAFQMGAGAVSSALLGVLGNNTERPMLLLMCLFSSAGMMIMVLLTEKKFKCCRDK